MRFFEANGFGFTPSISSTLRVDAGTPPQAVIDGLKSRGVYVGRPWAVWPTHVRVSLGTRAEMRRFKTAFLEVVKA